MLSLHAYIHTCIHTHVRTYVRTYIHKIYLNRNLSVAKKAETKVKLSDKSPNCHEKKHISQCYNDMYTYIHKLYLNTNLSVAKKANVFVLRVIDTMKRQILIRI